MPGLRTTEARIVLRTGSFWVVWAVRVVAACAVWELGDDGSQTERAGWALLHEPDPDIEKRLAAATTAETLPALSPHLARWRAALDQRPAAGEARQDRLQMFAAQPARRVEFWMAGHGWRSWGAACVRIRHHSK